MTPLLIGLIVAGIILITLEIFLPGGVLGVAAGICFAIAVVVAFRTDTNLGVWTLLSVLLVGALYLAFFTIVLPHTAIGKRFSLQDNIGGSGTAPNDHLVHQDGVAITDLRPGGVARLGDLRTDVISISGYIQKGTRIRVTSVEGASVMVQEISDEPAPPTAEVSAIPESPDPSDLPQF